MGVEVAVSRRRSSREGGPAGLQTCGGRATGGRRPHGGHPRGGGPRSEAARGGGLGGALATHSERICLKGFLAVKRVTFHLVLEETLYDGKCQKMSNIFDKK